MMTERCVLGMLVDTSTSMEVMGYEDILVGCNDFLDGQRKNDDDLGSVSKFYLGTFATDYTMRYNGVSLNCMSKLVKQDIPLYGMTAMYDGINGFINDISNKLEEGDKLVIFIFECHKRFDSLSTKTNTSCESALSTLFVDELNIKT